jgi:hypothetical protein
VNMPVEPVAEIVRLVSPPGHDGYGADMVNEIAIFIAQLGEKRKRKQRGGGIGRGGGEGEGETYDQLGKCQ